MAATAFITLVRTFAEEIGAIVWDGIPLGGARVISTQLDSKGFLNKVRRLSPAVVYLSPDSNTVAVAIARVTRCSIEAYATLISGDDLPLPYGLGGAVRQ